MQDEDEDDDTGFNRVDAVLPSAIDALKETGELPVVSGLALVTWATDPARVPRDFKSVEYGLKWLQDKGQSYDSTAADSASASAVSLSFFLSLIRSYSNCSSLSLSHCDHRFSS